MNLGEKQTVADTHTGTTDSTHYCNPLPSLRDKTDYTAHIWILIKYLKSAAVRQYN